MSKIAVFPGSFDPFTKGHEAVVRRGTTMFDKIVVAIGENTSKKYMFDLQQRIAMVESVFEKDSNVDVVTFSGLTVNYCKKIGASHILRGLRDEKDFGYERNIAIMNRDLVATIDTVFMITDPALSAISSTILREILKNKGDITAFLPDGMEFDY